MTDSRLTSLDDRVRLEAAADWLDREGELYGSERQAFERWYADADNRIAYQRVARAMGLVQPEAYSSSKSCAGKRRSWWLFAGSVAASLLLISGAQLWAPTVPSSADPLTTPLQIEASINVESKRGERRSRFLSDGSQLVLNAQSEVQVRLSAHERRVTLSQGQAFFDVVRDPRRPFVVEVGEAKVQVLGTRFDVDRTSAKTTIAVYEGTVNVQADRSVVLKGGEQVTVTAGRLGQVQDSKGSSPAWRTGWLDVREEPLVLVVDHLQRYLEQEVLVPSQLVARSVSGRFSLDRPHESLQLLAQAHGLKVEQGVDRLHLIPVSSR